MKVGILQDQLLAQRLGGASRAVDLYFKAAPENIEVVMCPPGSVMPDLDLYLTFLVKRYHQLELDYVMAQPFVRCGFDWWPNDEGNSRYRTVLTERARGVIWMSPLHKARFEQRYRTRSRADVIMPPPLDLGALSAAQVLASEGERGGAVWFAEWHPAKGPDLAAAWAKRQKTHLDMYSPSMPEDVRQAANAFTPFAHPRGAVPEADWYATIAKYKAFVHMPRVPDAFGYGMLEAYALGLETIVSGQLGTESFVDAGLVPDLEHLLEWCGRSAKEFWSVALDFA